MQIEANIVYVSPVMDEVSKAGKPYQKQYILAKIDEQSQYPQTLKIDCGKAIRGSNINLGIATLDVNLRGNEYTNKAGMPDAFTGIELWKIQTQQNNQPQGYNNQPHNQPAWTQQGSGPVQQQNNAPQQQQGPQVSQGTDDLPF